MPSCELFLQNLCPRIVEAHAIDDRFVRDRPKKPGRRIPWLRMGSYSSQLAKAEAQGLPGWQGIGVLVHSRRNADRIWKLQTENFDWKSRGGIERLQSIANQRVSAYPAKRAHGSLMNL